MESRDFLEVLLPPEGHLVLGVLPQATESNPRPKMYHKFHSSIDSLWLDAQQEQNKGRNVYVTPTTFATTNNRLASNATLVKSFFLDLDVGTKANNYESKKAAVQALAQFLETTQMPAPSLIDSGGGVHAYWVLEKAIPITTWFPLAVRLKKLCAKYEFKIDPTVVSDAARLMRMVGFKNQKRDSLCKVKTWAGTNLLCEITDVLDDHVPSMGWLESAKKDWMQKSSLKTMEVHPDRISMFKDIVIKSLRTQTGCAQIAACVTDQANTSEPLWRAALSVAWTCEDASTAIHKLSDQHPEYDYDVTVSKAMSTKGPYRCSTFEELNPAGCKDCPHKGNITSPIQLGATMRMAPAVQGGAHYQAEDTTSSVTRMNKPIPVIIPAYPEPYFRPESGGLGIRLDDADGVPMVSVLTDNDIWVQQIVRDSVTSDVRLWIRTYHAIQGVTDFLIPNCVNQLGELVKHLENKGLFFEDRSKTAIRQYLYQAVRKLNNEQRSLLSVNQFGWDNTFDSFVIGETRLTAGGLEEFAPPSLYTAPVSPMFHPRGSLKGWADQAQKFFVSDRTLLPHQLVILAAFGSPLFEFTGKQGVIISLHSDGSGKNKSLSQLVQLSSMGEPEAQQLLQRDTPKSKLERLGVLKNLSPAFEEVTMMDQKSVQHLTYAITEGRTHNQANQHGGGEKVSDRRWSLIATTSSNSKLSHKLVGGENSTHQPEANLVRMIEFTVDSSPSIPQSVAEVIARGVKENYGVVGRYYLKHLVGHSDAIKDRLQEIMQYVNTTANLDSKHRFLVALAATLAYAGELLNELGILKVNLPFITKGVLGGLIEYTGDIEEMVTDNKPSLSEFMNRYMRNCVQTQTSLEGKQVVVDFDRVSMPVRMRLERDEQRLFIPVKELRDFCTERGSDVKVLLDSLDAEGLLISRGMTKRLLSGVIGASNTPQVRCVEIKFTQGDE